MVTPAIVELKKLTFLEFNISDSAPAEDCFDQLKIQCVGYAFLSHDCDMSINAH